MLLGPYFSGTAGFRQQPESGLPPNPQYASGPHPSHRCGSGVFQTIRIVVKFEPRKVLADSAPARDDPGYRSRSAVAFLVLPRIPQRQTHFANGRCRVGGLPDNVLAARPAGSGHEPSRVAAPSTLKPAVASRNLLRLRETFIPPPLPVHFQGVHRSLQEARGKTEVRPSKQAAQQNHLTRVCSNG